MNPDKRHFRYLAPLGYTWGIALALGSPLLFFLSDSLAHSLAQLPFMKNHPRYSGGEVVRVESGGGAEWRIHRPVFDGLLSENDHGFVQIDVDYQGENAISRDIDHDGDDSADFTLSIPGHSSGEPSVTALSENVTFLERRAATRDGWIIRVGLDKPTTNNRQQHP
jgi:hypothetical protein